jgi:murein DD-endopeptidase MepM/ murein hydrolase activator NlpD
MVGRRATSGGKTKGRTLIPRSGRPQPPQITLRETSQAAQTLLQFGRSEPKHGSRLKWLVSSCLAAIVGVVTIGFVVLSSMEPDRHETGVIAFLQTAMQQSMSGSVVEPSLIGRNDSGKTARLASNERGLTTRHIIQDTVQEKRGGKQFILIKPYARIVARLSSTPPESTDQIPPFNPITLYAESAARSGKAGAVDSPAGAVTFRIADLAGQPPALDDEELTETDMADIVRRSGDEAMDGETIPVDASSPAVEPAIGQAKAGELPPHTVEIPKTVSGDEAATAIEGQEIRVVQVADGDTIAGVLKRNGADPAEAKEIARAAAKVLEADKLSSGEELRLTLVPSPTGDNRMQPMLVTLFSEGHGHLVSIARTPEGEFVASENPLAANLTKQIEELQNGSEHTSLYTSLYSTALSQGLSQEAIQRLVRVFAYDTDFRRRVGPGDSFEAFFDIVGGDSGGSGMSGHPGDLLYIALTVGGETRKFYRYRASDGTVDYYDAEGNNAKKFLMLKPVRGQDVRFTSGFGLRMHPLLHQLRMHTGVDWASDIGTPILASGNGEVVDMKHSAGNGIYLRIQHANGYQTAYSHMQKYAPNITIGSKVRQGQVIGYIGMTGLTNGPHLHFEVLVNGQFVDPMTIHVPRERQLTGRQLAEFQKERARIEELMNRVPVASLVQPAGGNG